MSRHFNGAFPVGDRDLLNEGGAERVYEFNEGLRPLWSLFQAEDGLRHHRVVHGFSRFLHGDNRDAGVAEDAI